MGTQNSVVDVRREAGLGDCPLTLQPVSSRLPHDIWDRLIDFSETLVTKNLSDSKFQFQSFNLPHYQPDLQLEGLDVSDLGLLFQSHTSFTLRVCGLLRFSFSFRFSNSSGGLGP